MAPDLFKSSAKHLSASGLAAVMWNHAPEMWEKMSAKWLVYKKFENTEMADLFAFIYFMRYLDAPGNPAKGEELLKTKGCSECHSIGGKGGRIGPDLAVWKDYSNPILWVQMMWNHAAKMKPAMEKGSLTWPKLERTDIVDIIAYVGTIGKPAKINEVVLASGDPLEGRKAFFEKGCGRCHSTEGTEKKSGPNLGSGRSNFPSTVGQLASLMWNHIPNMLKQMRQENIKLPELSAKEMADITAYLFAIRYFNAPGNSVAGGKIFEIKQCNVCHDTNLNAKAKKDGPNLAALKGIVSPIDIATSLWNHGPRMVSRMKEKNIKWQKINANELNNLIAYLNFLNLNGAK
jgi:cytochrome c2